MIEGQYIHEDEAIIDALAVAAILIKTDIRQFTELLNKARTKKISNKTCIHCIQTKKY